MGGINWIWFPQSTKPHGLALRIVKVFQDVEPSITSESQKRLSNEVLPLIAGGLKSLDFVVESGRKKNEKILVPVLFGLNGIPKKSFHADAYCEKEGFVLEVEAGRATDNNQFLKDLFQACLMSGVKYLCIAVRKKYRRNKDFDEVVKHFEALYASNRLKLPLDGILIVGY